jgi:hypothetical protein
MQQVLKMARGLSSPAILIVVVWCATLIGVAAGPIDYPMQPSAPVLVLVAVGVSLFVLAHQAGAWCFGIWLRPRPDLPAPARRLLNTIVTVTTLLGLAGIALIALDRMILSGAGNDGYADLLRCAPTLVDFIEIERTPLLYAGYLTFSFGFASLVLFLLRGDDIGGWAAILAQLSILSPVGYALLYSGRMPILFIIVLIVAAMLVRIGQGRRPLPRGRHLLVKMVVVCLLFAVYSGAMWSSRQAFCVQMSGLIRELQGRMNERDLARAGTTPPSADVRKAQDRETPPPKFADSISATDLRKMIAETKALPGAGRQAHLPDVVAFLTTMQGAWHVTPRGYVLSAIDSGRLSPNTAINFLSTYFYLTHGIRILDLTWRARARFSPHWGIYEIGVISPILRVFFPQNQSLASLSVQLKSVGVYGFFPTIWAAAYIDFGAVGAVIYVLIWGFAAGWAAFGARHSALASPALLLTFILASILLSPVEAPLGIANSAMVLASMVIVGMAVDFISLHMGAAVTKLDSTPPPSIRYGTDS